jgi:hypothetical protein
VSQAGAEPAAVDLEHASTEDVAQAIAGCDAVVFAAGAGPGSGSERKETMDYGGAVKLIAAAKQVGVSRYVIVSSMGADPDASGEDTFSVYLRAKGRADEAVRASGLDATVVRPGGLTNEPGAGRVRTVKASPADSGPDGRRHSGRGGRHGDLVPCAGNTGRPGIGPACYGFECVNRWPRRASSASAADLPVPDIPVIRTWVIPNKLARPPQPDLMRSGSGSRNDSAGMTTKMARLSRTWSLSSTRAQVTRRFCSSSIAI